MPDPIPPAIANGLAILAEAVATQTEAIRGHGEKIDALVALLDKPPGPSPLHDLLRRIVEGQERAETERGEMKALLEVVVALLRRSAVGANGHACE